MAAMTVGVCAASVTDNALKVSDIDKADKAPRIIKGYGASEGWVADYTSFDMVTAKGSVFQVSVSGTTFSVTGNSLSSIELRITETTPYTTVGTTSGTTNASIDLNGSLTEDMVYDVFIDIVADGISQHWEELYLVYKNGTLGFACSNAYNVGLESCSELMNDADYLAECLEPQNDIECDNPEIIRIANEITAGCSDDWEKSLAIYQYITTEFAYDYVQTDDDEVVYQDDALSLLRRKIAICEGLGNVYVALCRASGIPACEAFGSGETTQDFMNNHAITNDDTHSCNHAWAMVYLGGRWWSVDPTWDCSNSYEGDSYSTGTRTEGEATLEWYLLPLEYFSLSHLIYDADTRHGIESSGDYTENGHDVHWEISRDGVITLSGSGEVMLPEALYGFHTVVFADDSNFTSIGEQCFIDRDVLETVILPDTITRIENYAFYTCEDLEYIYLPDGLEYIGEQAFDYCDELAYVYVPDSVMTIGSWAFDDAPRLILSVPDDFSNIDSNYEIPPYRVIYR